METLVTIPSDIGPLEACFDNCNPERAVVITHPHPLYGGEMHNVVVESIARGFRQQQISTLRFNFRGVGRSAGKYDDGIGEQEDVLAAVEFLKSLGITTIEFSGYSFGAWVLFNLSRRGLCQGRLTFVSPPVDFFEFEKDTNLPTLALTIAGDRDDYASIDKLRLFTQEWSADAPLQVVQGADHFYSGCTDEIIKAIQQTLQ